MNNKKLIKILKINEQDFIKLEDIKLILRIKHSLDDELIKTFINAAIEGAEIYTNLALKTRSTEYQINYDYQSSINLKYAPIIELTKKISVIKNKDARILDTKSFAIDHATGEIVIKSSLNYHDKLIIRYISGTLVENIPAGIKYGIIEYVANMYDKMIAVHQAYHLRLDVYINYLELLIYKMGNKKGIKINYREFKFLISFFDNLSKNLLEDNWCEKYWCLSSISVINSLPKSIDSMNFKHYAVEALYIFKIRFSDKIHHKMKVKFENKEFLIKKINSLTYFDKISEIIALEI